MKDSDEGFLPNDLTPFEVTSDVEREDNIFDDDDDGNKDSFMPPSKEDLPHPHLDSSNDNEKEEGGDYEVERILLKPKGSNVYFVKWLGYNLNQATYENTWNLDRCKKI
uniref:Chromo domain-containing protein n=1 Tax=Panagrolaimus sp. PS1159 TaxID=55785 RepID=A0AC35EU03_9BILA